MATYLAPIGSGLGDLVLTLPVVQRLVQRGEETFVVLRSPVQVGAAEIIPGIAGAVREVDFQPDRLPSGDRYVNLRDHPMQYDHVWGSKEFEEKFPGYRITDIMHDICLDFGIDVDFERLQPLPFAHRADARGKVILLAGTDGEYKCWHKEGWLQLKTRLEKCGEAVAIVGEPHKSRQVKELLDAGLDWIQTPTLKDALNVLSSARAVVSVDTGLLHLALQQLVPVAGMWVNQPGSFYYVRTVKHCFPVVSPVCQPECFSVVLENKINLVVDIKQWQERDPCVCPFTDKSRCMNNVEVDSIWKQVTRALEISSVPV